jgi:hypothetical protein
MFAFSFLVCYITAMLYATRWSTWLKKLKGEKQIQTNIAPTREEHRDPSRIWYYTSMQQHVAGGIHGGIVVYGCHLNIFDAMVFAPSPMIPWYYSKYKLSGE